MKKVLIYALVCSAFLISLCAYASTIQKDISQNVIRLHIVANSDSEKDQHIKLEIRDEISNYLYPLLKNSKSINESEALIKNSLCEITDIANNILEKNGISYKATSSLSKKTFPTKTYSNVTLPSGEYKALCINLGKAEGQNWWCVMFPPLCLNSSTVSMPDSSKGYLKNALNEESYAILSADEKSPLKLVYRFKIFDYISSFKEKFIL